MATAACVSPELSATDERRMRARLASWSEGRLGLPNGDFDDAYQGAWRKLRETERRGTPTRNLEEALRWNIRNCWLEELRRRRRHPVAAIETCSESQLATAQTPDAQAELERMEAARYLLGALGELTDLRRKILILRDVWGLRTHEVCERLSISHHAYREEHAAALRSVYERLQATLASYD